MDRLEFSKANFNMPKDWVGKKEPEQLAADEQPSITESFNFKSFILKKNLTEDLNSSNEDSVVLWPGGFKPPHKGHFEALKKAVLDNNATHAVVFIGPKLRAGVNISASQSKAIWDIYLKYLPCKAEAIICYPNPVKPVYDYVDQHLEDYFKIIVAAGDKKDDKETNSKGDIDRYSGFKKHPKYNKVTISPIEIQGDGISGTLTRQKLATGNIDDALEYFLPLIVKQNKNDMLNIKNILLS